MPSSDRGGDLGSRANQGAGRCSTSGWGRGKRAPPIRFALPEVRRDTCAMPPALPAEKSLRFRSGDVELDGRLFMPEGDVPWGCVVCHPHPLYGGDMSNSVV